MTNIKLKDAVIASYSGGTDSLFEITLSCHRENVDAVLNEYGWLEVEIKSKDASKQEQPKVDLEKEVHRWKNEHGVVGMDDLWLNFAHHFYELGLNARKEE